MMKSVVMAQAPKQQRVFSGFKVLWARLCRLVRLWYQRDRQRHALASLSDSVLKDIGLSRSEALREYDKPFWRE